VRKQGESVLGSDKMKGLDKFMPSGPEQTNQMLGEGLEKIFSKMSDFSKGGDEDEKGKNMSLNIASNIAIVISSQLDGISPMLIELLIAIKTKDKEGIKTSVAKI
jgi:hypothetical protein